MMDEESVFLGGDDSESTQQDSIENTPLRVSAVHGDHSSHTVKPAAAGGRLAALASSIHDNSVARPFTVKGDRAESLLAARCNSTSQSPPKSGTMARKSSCDFGCSEQVVQVVSSPLVVVSSDEEIQLGRGSSPLHDRRAVHLPAASTAAVVPSAGVGSIPLIPEKAHVAKNAMSPPSLHRSHLRAAPTGGSDSDTEEESNCSRHVTPDAARRNSHIGNESAVEAEEREAEQHLVDEFGFVIDEDAKERDGKYIRGIDGKQVVRREIKWANMAADWNKTNTKMHAKLKERCRKGIPSRFRGVAWQLLMGSFHQLNSEENSGVYVALRDKKLADKETDAVISRDLARTFPTHVLFQDPGGVGQTFLRNVLHAYAGCDPEVGYVQGMAFIVAALSTQMAEEESFWALHEMMYNDRYKMRELFRPGFPLLQQFFYQLKRLIARLLPRLSKRLEELEIQPSFFASQWFLTLFVGHFPFRALLRVWDIFFSEGWKIIFRTGIALLKWEESHLLTLSFEDTLLALKGLQDGKDAYELLRRAHRVKFKTAELNRYGDEYWEMIGSIHRD